MSHIVDFANVRVSDASRCSRFVVEPSHGFFSPEMGLVQDFDCHTATDRYVLSLVDRSHAAFADQTDDLVLVSNGLTNQ